MTVSDQQLENIFKRIYKLGELNGSEQVLVNIGKLPNYIRKTEAVRRITLPSYNAAVEQGFLTERKLDPNKTNSPIVVDRKEFNYVESILKTR